MEFIREEIKEVVRDIHSDASPNFVLFICAWNGYFPPAKIKPFAKTGEYPGETLRQRIYREHHNDSDYYDEIKNWWTENRRIELMETLFSLGIKGQNPRNRPRKMEKWMTEFDLRNYFEYLTGDRQTDSISQIISIIDNSDKGTDSASEMQKRRRWLEGIDGKVRLKMLLRFFKAHERTIEESLKSEIPLYKILEEKKHQYVVYQAKPMADKEMVAGIKLEPWTEEDARRMEQNFFKEGKWVDIPPEGLRAMQIILDEINGKSSQES